MVSERVRKMHYDMSYGLESAFGGLGYRYNTAGLDLVTQDMNGICFYTRLGYEFAYK